VRTVIDNTNRKTTTTDLEIFGMRLGIQCAQRILRGYSTDPADPDPSALHVLMHFGKIENEFVEHQRATNGLTDDGELAYRKGVARGVQSQMKNPDAKIEIKVI
jgi:hypothetical protein